ncbi:hypothetical protein BTH42_32675 [Burkholderia sp. SRS-W-2-2016]|uniref:hypothetical protein n=1 Tax=Burkholderia sp. SRS-W-2-2016 TaxID=1926878 RepID=UPI00094AF7AA|nr:hypothetical protein [Burkholderia sp. SRS-W-2-2016]OLL27578.1 hypothetical protein BTH42_32675 [Burkholderia sp. SRS-W-2-2016]
MKMIVAATSAISVFASTCAYAQTSNDSAKPANPSAEQSQPGNAGQNMGRAANAGETKPASGTLMQKRQNAMSPQGASNSNTTGTMKQ